MIGSKRWKAKPGSVSIIFSPPGIINIHPKIIISFFILTMSNLNHYIVVLDNNQLMMERKILKFCLSSGKFKTIVLLLLYDFLSLKNDVNLVSKSN